MQLENDYNPNWVDDDLSAAKVSAAAKPKPPEWPSDFDPVTYRACGTFSGIYQDRWEHLLFDYDLAVGRTALLILVAIAHRCGPLGTCFRLSQNYLKDHARTNPDGVKAALVLLGDQLGWIRQHSTFLPSRNRTQVDWQVSPFTLWIAAPSAPDAFGLWKVSQPLQTDHFFEHTESRTRGSRRFIQSNHPAEGSRPARKGKNDYKKPDYIEVPIENCRQPLKNTAEEQTAQDIVRVCQTHLSQARQMVATYGAKAVYTELVKLTERQQTETIFKMGGALVAALRREYGKTADQLASGENGAPPEKVLDFREL